jgi:hypothetical protein
MYQEYVIDYEVWNDKHAIKWGTYTCTYQGEYAPATNVFTKDILMSIAEYRGCEPESVRIRGVFKL